MPSVNKSYVFGAREVIAQLQELGVQVPVTLMRRALYAGGVVIRDEARKNVVQRHGALKKSIIVQTKRTGKGKNADHMVYIAIAPKAFTINAKGKLKLSKRWKKKGERKYKKGEIYPRNYAHLVEFGTRPHLAGKRRHPGARKKPFLRPAFDNKHREAVAAIRSRLAVEIEKLIRKHAVKTLAKARRS